MLHCVALKCYFETNNYGPNLTIVNDFFYVAWFALSKWVVIAVQYV